VAAWRLADRYKNGWPEMSGTAPLAVLRLPSPPTQYQQGYMARLTSTLELEKQATYFANSSSLNTAVQQAEATAWFIS
jgi:hypothetical protein